MYISQDRTQHDLQKLCDDCLLQAANETLKLGEVITLLWKIGRAFTSHLSYNIITRAYWQRIDKAITDDEALGHIRAVCFYFLFLYFYIL